MPTSIFQDDGTGVVWSDVLFDSGDIKMRGAGKIYVDNDNDSYFESAADDVLDLYIAGSKDFIFSSNKLELQPGTYIASGSAIAVGYHGAIPNAAQQALSGAGAVTLTEYYTTVTTTGANALTLGDADAIGQLKKIQMIVDAGDATLTPTTLVGGTTITFADVGDTAELMWTASGWRAIALYNVTDGATAPVLA